MNPRKVVPRSALEEHQVRQHLQSTGLRWQEIPPAAGSYWSTFNVWASDEEWAQLEVYIRQILR